MKYIMGVGNYTMFDDSIGIRLIEHISENNLQQGFQAIDISSNSLNIVSYLTEETEKILVIDAIKVSDRENRPELADKKPGDFIFFSPARVESHKMLSGITSHEGDIIKVIELARQTGHYIPEIVCMGILPAEVKNAFGLSEPLQENFSKYIDVAIEKITY